MNDMEKMMSVLEAYRSSEKCRKLLSYLDEIEDYIDDVIEEGTYEDELQMVRDYIIQTNEFNWHHYFKEPVKQAVDAIDKEIFTKRCYGDSCPI